MKESLITGILLFGILQSLFFALLFITKKTKALPDKIMGAWLLVLAVQTFLIFVNHQPQNYPLVRNSSLLLTLLYGPMLFLYVFKFSFSKTRFIAKDCVHLIPFLLFLLLLLVVPGNKSVLVKLLGGASALSGFLYCIICFILLNNHQHNIENTFSNIEKINLAWVNRLVVSLLILWTGVFILVILNRFLLFKISLDWFFTMIPLFIFYIGYFGIKQQTIYYSIVSKQDSNKETVIPKTRKSYDNSYAKSGLMPDSMSAIHVQLVTCMERDKLFLNPTLSLADLSEKLNIPPHHITQTLNGYANLNFYEFVNEFRVEEFKHKIKSGEADEFSLLGIAFDCGFNSKSSFNRIFKKQVGLSPSEFHNRLIGQTS